MGNKYKLHTYIIFVMAVLRQLATHVAYCLGLYTIYNNRLS